MTTRGTVAYLLSTIMTFPLVFACDVNYTQPYGTITSPGYPNNYPKDQDCRATILAPDHTNIMIIFRALNLEHSYNCNDYVKLYPVITNTVDDFIRLCGSQIPGLMTSITNNVTIEFHSDSSIEKAGFILQWKFLDTIVYQEEQLPWQDASTRCTKDGGTLAGLDSLSYSQIRTLWISNNITEAWSDSYYSPWMWIKGCLREPFEGQYTATNFKTNRAALCVNHCRNSYYFGLKGNSCICIGWFDGVLLKPDDHCKLACPGNQAERCGGNSAFTVYMNDFCYQNSTTWLGTVSQTMQGERCKPWSEVFNASWDSEFPDGSVQNASNYCRDMNKYGLLWCYNEDNVWRFCDVPKCFEKGTPDQMPSSCLSFQYGGGKTIANQIPCESKLQYIYIRDKVPQYSNKYYDWTTAWGRFTNHVYSTGFIPLNIIGLFWRGFTREKTDLSNVYNADNPTDCFKIHVDVQSGFLTESPAKCNQSRPFFCQYAASTCGETLTSSNGTFTSPLYPMNYTSYLNCIWRITVTPGHFIHLEFDMDIEDAEQCNSDFIKVYDGNNTNDQIIANMCGLQNWTIETSTNHVIINFQTDFSVSLKGFQAEWRAVPVPLTTGKPATNTNKKTVTRETQAASDTNSAWIYIAIAVGAVSMLLLILLIFINRRCRGRKQLPGILSYGIGNQTRSDTYTITTVHQRPSVKQQPNNIDISNSGLEDSEEVYINSLVNAEISYHKNTKLDGDSRVVNQQNENESENTYANTLERHTKGFGVPDDDVDTCAHSEKVIETDNSLAVPEKETLSRSSSDHLYYTIEKSNDQSFPVSPEDCVYSSVNKEIHDNKTMYDHITTSDNTPNNTSDLDNDQTPTYDHTNAYDHTIPGKNLNDGTYNHLDDASEYDISYSGGVVKQRQFRDPTYNTLSQTVKNQENTDYK